MSLFDIFRSDRRKKFASMVVSLYRTVQASDPSASEKRLAENAFGVLYDTSPMPRKAFLSLFGNKITNIYDLAYAIFDAEQHVLGKGIFYHLSEEGLAYTKESYQIIDMELTRLGYPKPNNYERQI